MTAQAGGVAGTTTPNALVKANTAGLVPSIVTDDGTTVNVPGADSFKVNSKIIPQHVYVVLGNMNANSLSGDSPVFIAHRAYQIVGIKATWSHVGGSGALALPEKLTGTTVPGSGNPLLSTSGFDLTTTANTVNSGALTATGADLLLAVGDRVGVKLSGTLTALTGLNITLQLQAV